ncbi:MAG: PAS domain S-box protein [Smithellaceae bacterium]
MAKNMQSEMNNSQSLRVLIVDDSEDDVLLEIRELKKGGYDPEYKQVETAAALIKALREQTWDVILCDYKMPQFTGPKAISLYKETNIDVPFIIVSGAIGEETAVECMLLGAHDYIMKDNLARLVPAIKREVVEAGSRAERRRAEEELQESEERFRKLFENHAAVKLLIDSDTGNIIDANEAASAFYGWSKEQLKKMKIQDINILPPEEVKQEIKKVLSQKRIRFEFQHRLANGLIRDVEVFSSKIDIKGKECLHSIVNDITERKKAEEELRESEARFRTLADSGMALIWTQGIDKKCDYFNKPWLKLTGRTLEQELGHGWVQGVHPDDRDRCFKTVNEAIARREKFSMDLRLLCYDGKYHWIQDDGTPRYNSKGEFIGFIGHCLDITDRKHAEEKLQHISAIQNLILENSTLGIALVRNRVFEWVNTRLGELLMLPLDQIQGSSTRVMYPSDEVFEERANKIYPILARGERSDSIMKLRRSDGTLIWCRFMGKALNPEKPSDGSIWMFEDITERKTSEDELKKKAAEISDLYNNAPCGYHSVGRDGIITHINDTELKWLGYESDEIVGKKLLMDILTPDSQADIRRVALPLFKEQGWINNMEYEMIRKDGSVFPVLVNAQAVRYKDGHLMETRATVFDITEPKKISSELQKKNLELAEANEELRKKQAMIIQQEKMASIGMLAAGIAHEIKNPLAIILQGINYLQTTITNDSLLVEVIERMNKAVFRADIIVKGLLSYARQNPLSLSRQDVLVLIDESLVLTEHEFRKKNLQVIKKYEQDLPKISADGNQIKQVFVNILLNGADAMSKGGTFTISARQASDAGGKKIIEISIKDTGHGIPAGKIEKIFDPFYTTKDIGNTGLGLSISKGIIDSHGGIIYVESQDGKGATFIIQLPVQ